MVGCYLGGMQFKLTEDDSRGQCYGETEVETHPWSGSEIVSSPHCRCFPYRNDVTVCLCVHTAKNGHWLDFLASIEWV